jgi:hypothetical protein
MFDPFERLSICGSIDHGKPDRVTERAIDSPAHDPMVRKDDGTFTAHFDPDRTVWCGPTPCNARRNSSLMMRNGPNLLECV